MNGASQIAAVGQSDAPAGQHTVTAAAGGEAVYELNEVYEDEEQARPRNLAWIAPTLAILAVLAWSGFFAFAHQASLLGGVTPAQASDLTVQWAVPVVLIVGLWLLAMRSSRREAVRFGEVAHSLRGESAQLETRLITVNRELSLARDFIAAQSRDLESLGRVASERLADNAERMSTLIHANTAQIESIASVSTTALENMDKLRTELPVVANSARDVTSQIGNAGRTARSEIAELIAGLQRVNEFGDAGTKLIAGLQGQIDTAMASFETRAKGLGDASIRVIVSLNERLAALEGECGSVSASIRETETAALGNWEASIERLRAGLGEALREIAEIDSAALDRTRARLSALDEEARRVDTAMVERAESFMAEIAARRATNDAQMAEIGEAIEARLAGLGQIDGLMENIAGRNTLIGEELADAVDRLSTKLAANRDILDATGGAIAGLTDSSARLLDLIQAGSRHSREQLPAAIATAEARLADFEQRSRNLAEVLGEAAGAGEKLSDQVAAAEAGGKALTEELGALHAGLAEHEAAHAARIDALRQALTALSEESGALTRRADGELNQAVERLQQSLRSTLDEFGSGHSAAIDGLASRIGEQSAGAIERAIKLQATEAIGALEQAAAHASGVGREAARQLRDQLAKVDELAGNLENRVTRARERAEEQVDNDFARRVALITESLNSHSIDIAKALSNDVTDTAWVSYLRGDRGIFTRRAVRLLDNSEAREIAEIYDQDREFREHVSRYIHDFEGMLRTMLSTRDGNALGVTLLSSDMGKLYVALAQAIERLRS
ncbi:MAG: ATPase [Novosphingobium sp.]|nr:ATPase [Novosphingobium sp.]MBO9603785.1 ATPase [Novosphingobium sp.]